MRIKIEGYSNKGHYSLGAFLSNPTIGGYSLLENEVFDLSFDEKKGYSLKCIIGDTERIIKLENVALDKNELKIKGKWYKFTIIR